MRTRSALSRVAVAVGITLALVATRSPWSAPSADEHRHDVTDADAEKPLWTCGMHPEVIRDEPGLCPICHMKLTPLGNESSAGPGGAIRIDPVIVQNVGIRVAVVRRADVARGIRATGTLEEAESNVHDVNLRVSGWVERLYADTVGMHVEAGAPLFELYSPELQVAVDELIASRRGSEADGAAGARAMLVQATRRKLERYGLRSSEIDRLAVLPQAPRTVTFTSPVTGHVTERRVVAGAAVQAGERVLRIVDHSTLWLDAQVHPEDLPLVALGTTLTARIEGARGGDVEGVVGFVHPHVDPRTRTATVRARIPNPDLSLRPGMYATVRIAATVATDALVVPREAVIDTGTRQLLFVAADGGRFEPREVSVGETGDDGVVEVRRGVTEGERVVTSGQFLLDAESRTQEAIRKHLAERAPAGAP